MNCAQHTDTAAVAYCRSCGKALCDACKREVQGTIFCEPCLAARINSAASGNFGAMGANQGANQGVNPGTDQGPVRAAEDASPGLALFLGFIPGVGAFYNGQFMKGFVHVIVFSTLIWMSDHGMGGFAGVLIMAWFFYMVFDAYATAKARRFGWPIPDPLGLNAILEGKEGTFRQRVEQAGERVGAQVEYAAQNIGQHWQKAGGAVPGANVPPGGVATNAAAGVNQGAPPPPPGAAPNAPNAGPGTSAYVGPQGTYYSGPEGTYYVAPAARKERERGPVGAIVLIGFGLLFLLANLGWFSFNWISHFWPAILIVIGVWLFIKRQRGAR
jgi:TM2 domain-containing membrane protein YozV